MQGDLSIEIGHFAHHVSLGNIASRSRKYEGIHSKPNWTDEMIDKLDGRNHRETGREK
jgi:hypothetical protein